MTADEVLQLVQESIAFFDQGVFPGNPLPFTVVNGPPVDGQSNFNFRLDRDNGNSYLLYRTGAADKVASIIEYRHFIQDPQCSAHERKHGGPRYTLEVAVADMGAHEVRHRLQFEDSGLERFGVTRTTKIPALKFLTKLASGAVPLAINSETYDAFEFDAYLVGCLIAHEYRRGRTDSANLFSVVKLTPRMCLEVEPFKSRYGR